MFCQTPVSAGVQLGFTSGRNGWGLKGKGNRGARDFLLCLAAEKYPPWLQLPLDTPALLPVSMHYRMPLSFHLRAGSGFLLLCVPVFLPSPFPGSQPLIASRGNSLD